MIKLPDTTGNNIQSKCRSLPFANEWREWFILFNEAFGYDRAKAICAYIRWRFRGSRIDELPAGIPRPQVPPIAAGPGTELHRLITDLGISPNATCGCEAMRHKMNAWAAAGCREHREEILAHLRTAYSGTDWPTVFAAALSGATHLWLVKRINPLHPIESGLAALLDEAIERGEQPAE